MYIYKYKITQFVAEPVFDLFVSWQVVKAANIAR